MRRTGRKSVGAHAPQRPWWLTHRWVPVILILSAAAILPYLNSLRGEFHFDDYGQVADNEGLQNLKAQLESHSPTRWLTFATFWLNSRLHDREFMPGWHAVNILLHVGCVLALYWALTLLAGAGASPGTRSPASGIRAEGDPAHRTRHRPPDPGRESRNPQGLVTWPFVAAALFAVHPLASEPVNYIQARCVILYTLFTLLALAGTIVIHRGTTPTRRLGGAVLTAVSIVLAASSKEVGGFFAVAVPIVYVLLFVAPAVEDKRRFWRISAAAGLAMLAVSLAWLCYSGAIHGIVRRMAAEGRWYWWGEMVVFWRYLWRAAVPLPSLLSVDHYVPYRAYSLLQTQVLAAVAALLGFVVLPAFWWARSRPQTSLLLLLIPLGLAPYFVMTSWEMMVEYRFYLPLTAFCGLAATAAFYLLRQVGRPAPLVLAGVFVMLGVLTAERNRAWRTEVSLWEDAVQKAPRKARAVNGLAWALMNDKSAPNPRRAMELAKRSFDPRFVDLPPGYNPYMVDTLAEAYYANGLHDQAVQLERDILRRRYDDPLFIRQLARFEAARTQSARVLEADANARGGASYRIHPVEANR